MPLIFTAIFSFSFGLAAKYPNIAYSQVWNHENNAKKMGGAKLRRIDFKVSFRKTSQADNQMEFNAEQKDTLVSIYSKPSRGNGTARDKFSKSRDFRHGIGTGCFNPALSIIWKFRIQFFGEFFKRLFLLKGVIQSDVCSIRIENRNSKSKREIKP